MFFRPHRAALITSSITELSEPDADALVELRTDPVLQLAEKRTELVAAGDLAAPELRVDLHHGLRVLLRQLFVQTRVRLLCSTPSRRTSRFFFTATAVR